MSRSQKMDKWWNKNFWAVSEFGINFKSTYPDVLQAMLTLALGHKLGPWQLFLDLGVKIRVLTTFTKLNIAVFVRVAEICSIVVQYDHGWHLFQRKRSLGIDAFFMLKIAKTWFSERDPYHPLLPLAPNFWHYPKNI